MLRCAVVLLTLANLLGCASVSYAQFVGFAPSDGENAAFAGCRSSFDTPSHLEMRCPDTVLVVDDSLREFPYETLRRWPEDEAMRQKAAFAGLDNSTVRVSVEQVTLADGGSWPSLRAVSLAGQEGLTPVEDAWIIRAPFDRDGVREIRCTATGPLGADRCTTAVPALLAATPAASLPPEHTLFEECESARFPLHSVRGATRTQCKSVRLVEHDRAPELPNPEDLARAFGLSSGTVDAEVSSLPTLEVAGGELVARAFTLSQDGRVVWSGVLAQDVAAKRFLHCGMQLPPALAQRHCYRAVVIKLTGHDQLTPPAP